MIPKVKYYGPRIPSTYAVNMTAAASGSNGITVADDDDIDFGTGDFAISAIFAYQQGVATTKAEENFLTYSQSFTNAIWGRSNIALTANSTTAPDTTSTATTMLETATTGQHRLSYTITTTAQTYTLSIFVKSAGRTKVGFREGNLTGAYASYELSGAGTVLSTGNGTTASSISALGDSWYRITYTFTASAGSSLLSLHLLPDSYTTGSPAGSYTGDGTSGVYVWGAQLEARSSVAAYTATTSAAITKNVYWLALKYQDGSNYWGYRVSSTGLLEFIAAVGGLIKINVQSTAAITSTNEQIIEATATCSRESSGTAGSAAFYVNGTQLGAAVSISAASPSSLSNSGSLYIMGSDSVRNLSRVIQAIVMNFAPTAAEVLDLCTNGIPASWKWGSQTNIGPTNGDFETWTVPTNPGTWSEGSNVSASVSQVTGGSQYAGTYSLQFTGAGLPSSTFNNTIFQSNFWSNPVLGKKYRIRVAAKRTSGSGDLYIGQGGTEFSSISTASGLSTSWALFTIEKTITSNAGNASSFVIAGASGSVFQVDAITVEQIGATMALLPDTIPTSSATTWSDTSGNTGGGTLPAAGATKVTIRK